MPEHGPRYFPSLRRYRAKICLRKQREPGHRHDEQTHVDESLEAVPIAPNDDATTTNVINFRLIYATTSTIDALTIYDWSTDVAANAIVDVDASLTTNVIVSTTTAVVA